MAADTHTIPLILPRFEIIHHPHLNLFPIFGCDLDAPCVPTDLVYFLKSPQMRGCPSIIRLLAYGLNELPVTVVLLPFPLWPVVLGLLLTDPSAPAFMSPKKAS